MKKKRPRRAQKPPPQPGATARRPGAGRLPAVRPPGHLQYKVVELSTVDEGSLERALNTWTPQGWNLDGIQFAMREASKRPAMAFVFFTREVAAAAEQDPAEAVFDARSPQEAREHLARLAAHGEAPFAGAAEPGSPGTRVDPWVRLAQLAGEEDAE